ncbi:hypothetical protein TNCV_783261 [Trichonephila clavipes]|nr:hypothetical protein TNCV_783261 [Trichonephila clavipes]
MTRRKDLIYDEIAKLLRELSKKKSEGGWCGVVVREGGTSSVVVLIA